MAPFLSQEEKGAKKWIGVNRINHKSASKALSQLVSVVGLSSRLEPPLAKVCPQSYLFSTGLLHISLFKSLKYLISQ